jgi:prepilin-type N-terminal cleavage/methylation domain-containing protein
MVNLSNYFKQKTKSAHKSGFSLIEVLLVMAIFSMVVYLGLPLIRGAFYQSDLEDASLLLVSSIRQAQNNARNGLGDSVWGVRINPPEIVIFKGAGWDTRDPNYDTGINASSNISFSGLNEVRFSKLEGLPSTTGNIILTNLNTNTITVNINAKGTLSY